MLPSTKFKRPRRGETQEDLEKQEREFLAQINRDKDKVQEEDNESATGKDKRRRPVEEVLKQFNIHPEEDKDTSCSLEDQLQIREKNLHHLPVFSEVPLPTAAANSSVTSTVPGSLPNFAGNSEQKSVMKKKVSLFAKSRVKDKQQQQIGNGNTSPSQPTAPRSANVTTGSPTADRKSSPPIVVGDQIHPLLAGMTEAEILEEQRRLIAKMDPKLVEFVRSRNKQKKPEPVLPSSVSDEQQIPPKGDAELPPPRPPLVPCCAEDEMQVTSTLDEEQYKNLPINPDEVKSIPHMDKIEPDKLAWTLPVTDGQCSAAAATKGTDATPKQEGGGIGGGRNARFDFQGKIATEDKEKDKESGTIRADSSWLSGLHHHGEEMERAGYTLEELLTLSRSTNIGQRSTAFNTLAAIFRNAHDGMFDTVLDKSLFAICLEMDFIYVVRKGIDSTDLQTINAALNCLSSLLYAEREDMALDSVYVWEWMQNHNQNGSNGLGPSIKVKCPQDDDSGDGGETDQPKQVSDSQGHEFVEEKSEDRKDAEILDRDLLEFLITRSVLLDRFEYIVLTPAAIPTKAKQTTVAEPATDMNYVLQILIRVARYDTEFLLEQPASMRLLDYFVRNYLQATTTCLAPFPSSGQEQNGITFRFVLKYLRILISASTKSGNKILQLYSQQIFNAVREILSCEDLPKLNIPQVEFLVQECILIWSACVNTKSLEIHGSLDWIGIRGSGIDEYFEFSPNFVKVLDFYVKSHTMNLFDVNFVALSMFLMNVVLYQTKQTTGRIVCDYFYGRVQTVKGILVKVCTILRSSHLREQVDVLLDGLLSLLQQCLEFFSMVPIEKSDHGLINEAVGKLISSDVFQEQICRNVQKSSMLLSEEKPTGDKYPSNMLFTEAIFKNGKLNPILKQGGTIFTFTTTLARYLLSNRQHICSTSLLNPTLMSYLQKLKSQSSSLYGQDNYYLQFELNCVYKLLELVLQVSEEEEEDSGRCKRGMCVKLSYKLCSLVQTGDQSLCRKFVQLFLESVHSTLSTTTIAAAMENGEDNLDFELGDLLILYFKLIESQCEQQDNSSTNFKHWRPKLMNSQWLTQPLHAIYMTIQAGKEFTTSAAPIQPKTFRPTVQLILKFVHCCLNNTDLNLLETKAEFVLLYMRICECFLMTPDIFLYNPIRDLLAKIFRSFCNHKLFVTATTGPIFNADSNIIGHGILVDTPFETFYSDLMSEFSGCSYGDAVFTAYVLLPILRAQESTSIKQRFWIDQSIQFVCIDEDNDLIALDKILAIGNEERNEAMLRLFAGLLKSGRLTAERNPFIYKLLSFHLRL